MDDRASLLLANLVTTSSVIENALSGTEAQIVITKTHNRAVLLGESNSVGNIPRASPSNPVKRLKNFARRMGVCGKKTWILLDDTGPFQDRLRPL